MNENWNTDLYLIISETSLLVFFIRKRETITVILANIRYSETFRISNTVLSTQQGYMHWMINWFPFVDNFIPLSIRLLSLHANFCLTWLLLQLCPEMARYRWIEMNFPAFHPSHPPPSPTNVITRLRGVFSLKEIRQYSPFPSQ